MTSPRQLAPALLTVAVLLPLASPAGAQEWRPLGPFGGTVISLAVDPFSPNVVLAGVSQAGLYRSANRGGAWAPALLLNDEVRVIAFDPRSSGVVYAATSQHTVLKSVDHGETWEPAGAGLPGGEDTPVLALALNPRRPSTLYAAVSGGTGLYKSADAGESWSPLSLPPSPGIAALAVDPFGVVWAAATSAIFKSRDGGATWQRSRIERAGFITTIAISPNAIYVGTVARGLFKSTDHGATWRRLGGVVANRNVSVLAVVASGPSTLYAGLRNDPSQGLPAALVRSSDGGSRWSDVSAGLPREDVLALTLDPAAPSRLYAGFVASGVFRSGNGGRHWVEANRGLHHLAVSELAADPQHPGTLYAGPTERGLFKTVDGGGSWEVINERLRGPFQIGLALDPVHPGTVYASAGGVLERSDDGGQSWRRIDAGLRQAVFLGPIASRPRPPSILYANTVLGVFRSTDRGRSWQAPAAGFGCLTAEEIAVSPAAPADVYASALSLTSGCDEFSGAFKSTDNGVSWMQISVGEPVGTLTPHPTDPAVVYGLGAEGVLRSADGGLHFAPVGRPDGVSSLLALAIDPFDPDTLYVGTDGAGVFVSEDAGSTWELLGEGLDGVSILVLKTDPASPGRIWAGTSQGIFVFNRNL